MKSIVAVVSLALVAVACESRPARDPSQSSTSTTAAQSDGNGSARSTVYSTPPSARGTQNPSSTGGPTATTGSANEAASGSRGIEQQSPDSPSSTSTGNTSASSALVDSSANRAGDQGQSKNADNTKNVDNTKNNERDRHGTLTSGDQGNSGSETKITADIRKQLVVSKTLSMTAKNAKIITTGTKVTLRGTVKSEQEKSEIEGVAKATNGVATVDNQLEVKK